MTESRIYPVLDDLHLSGRSNSAEHRAQGKMRGALEACGQFVVSGSVGACGKYLAAVRAVEEPLRFKLAISEEKES